LFIDVGLRPDIRDPVNSSGVGPYVKRFKTVAASNWFEESGVTSTWWKLAGTLFDPVHS
jgi:hypothetical protein